MVHLPWPHLEILTPNTVQSLSKGSGRTKDLIFFTDYWPDLNSPYQQT